MRDAPRLILVTILILGTLAPLSAQTVLYQAKVKVPSTRVSSGASGNVAYDTDELKQGQVVDVVGEAGAWLAIVPPPGSFSWVSARDVTQVGPHQWAVAVAEPGTASVMVGSWLNNNPPTVIGTQLKRGTVVTVMGPSLVDTNKVTWLPISPTFQEVRYISADAVTRQSLPPSAAVAALPATTTTWENGKSLPATLPKVVTSAAPAGDIDGLIQQARLRETERNWAEAARLYEQIAELSTANPVVAKQWRDRAAWDLQQGGLVAQQTQTPTQTGGGGAYQLHMRTVQLDQQGKREEAAQGYERLGEMFAKTDYQRSSAYFARAAWLRTSAPATTNSAVTDSGVRPASAQASVASQSVRTPQTPEPRAISAKSSGPGRLQRSSERIDGKPTYLFEGVSEAFYVIAEPGVVLESYLGKDVELLGQFVPHPEYRIRTLSAKIVIPLVVRQ